MMRGCERDRATERKAKQEEKTKQVLGDKTFLCGH